MSDQFFYTHHVKFHGSSALDEAFYSEDLHRLYVKFLNGNVAGYLDVQPNVWDSLAKASSAGNYYNSVIKYWYRGTHNDVVFVPKAPEQSPAPVENDATGASEKTTNTGNTYKPDYVVTVAVNGTLQFTVPAANARAAIQNVEHLLAQSGAAEGSFEIEGVNKA